MAKQTVDCLVEGGKASAGPPIGSSLGPLGVNVAKIVQDINKKTESFKGMQVPVKIIVDSETKAYEISIGTPPASSLIIKEAKIQKGAANPLTEKVADLRIEQIIKISKMKQDDLLGKTTKERVKEIIGTCQSMGILVHGVPAPEAIKMVNSGKFDNEIKLEKTELTAEELAKLEEEKKHLAEEIVKRREEYVAKAKAIAKEFEGKENSLIRSKMKEAKIPEAIMNEIAPAEAKKDAAGGAGAKK